MQQRRRHNRLIIGLLSLGLLAGAALTASPAQAVSGPGPLYPEPAWDQKKGAGRFVVLTNWNREAVLDKETGLVWEQSTQTATATWSDARFVCTGKSTGGRKGWRLPSMPELASLIELPPTSGLALPAGHPFTNVLPAFYWSATTHAENPTAAWFVNFFNGNVNSAFKNGRIQVWCVRGGMNADQY